MKKYVGIGVTAIIGIVGSIVAYRCGCQHGVDVAEKIVKEYAPETHELITNLVESKK